MTKANTTNCPWCGRAMILNRSGVAPRHKRVTGTDPVTGLPARGWCDGSSELPWMLGAEQRRQLRSRWRDDHGELLGGDDQWS